MALARLAAHIQVRASGAWLWQRPAESADALAPPAAEWSRERTLEQIGGAICQIKYEDGQDPHTSNIAPGVVCPLR
jgi:hypothetical protein